MLFVAEIECDNEAFESSRPIEVARILRDLADRIANSSPDTLNFGLRDINGNQVGAAEFFPER
jgi:hypothetical protein